MGVRPLSKDPNLLVSSSSRRFVVSHICSYLPDNGWFFAIVYVEDTGLRTTGHCCEPRRTERTNPPFFLLFFPFFLSSPHSFSTFWFYFQTRPLKWIIFLLYTFSISGESGVVSPLNAYQFQPSRSTTKIRKVAVIAATRSYRGLGSPVIGSEFRNSVFHTSFAIGRRIPIVSLRFSPSPPRQFAVCLLPSNFRPRSTSGLVIFLRVRAETTELQRASDKHCAI